MRFWKLYALIIVFSCLPLIDIFRVADLPHTSDGLVHTARFAEYYRQTIAGQIPVRWASQFNYGYGSPLFNFSHPLPYIFGLPFVAVGIPLVMVLKMTFATTYILAGIFMLLFSLAYFKNAKVAFFVAVMYQFAPFRLVEMLVRGSIGSLWAYALVPLIFFAITKFIETRAYRYFALLSFSVGLLLLSHNVLGIVFFAAAALYIFFATKDKKTAVLSLLALGTGVGVAAFFVLPVMLEYKYINGYLFSKHLFYLHFPPLLHLFIPNFTNAETLRTAEIPVQIGLVHTLALLATAQLLIRKKIMGKERRLAVYLLFVSITTLFFIEPISTPLWEKIHILRQFQFPWRLLSLICFTSAWAGSFLIIHVTFLRKKIMYAVLTGLVILSTVFYWVPYQGYQKFSQEFFWNFPKSTTYFADVNTIWMADEPQSYPKKRVEVIAGKAMISDVSIAGIQHEYNITAEGNATILDRTYFYPGWKAIIDGVSVPIQFQDQNYRGLITFGVGPGLHKVHVVYGQNKLQQVSNFISLLTIVGLLSGYFVFSKKRKHEA